MKYDNIIYEKKEGIARITLNRPGAMNAITVELLKEIKDAILDASRDKGVKVIVLTGAGRAFSAGVDLKALGDRKLERGKVGDFMDSPARDLIDTIQSVPKVVIAVVNGYCFTGAIEIVLACDLVLASEEAKFGDTHAKWGLRPTWGMSQRLPRMVGILKAKELSFTADTIDAHEAERIGLVNKVVPKDRLEEALQELARKLISNSQQSLAAYKYLYNRGLQETLEKGLEMERNTEFDFDDTEERLAGFRKKS